MSRIRIANPIRGGSEWTSITKAKIFISTGRAVLRDGRLVFLGPMAGFRRRLESGEFERSVREGRGDRVYWNGSAGPGKTRRPGEVVS